jgi:hypothetical protein
MPTASRRDRRIARWWTIGLLAGFAALGAPLHAVAPQGAAFRGSPNGAGGSPNFPTGVFRADDGTTVTVDANGSLYFIMPTTSWTGHYRIRRDTVWVTDDSPACARAGEGRYRWAFDGTLLTLTLLKDPCEPRVVAGPLIWRRTATANPHPGSVIGAGDTARRSVKRP